MALSFDAIFNPINDYFVKRFQTGADNPVQFRFDKFGSVISNQDFIDPNHPELGYSSSRATEKFSDLVNHIPSDNGDGINIVFRQDAIDDAYFFRLLSPAQPCVSGDSPHNQGIIDAFSTLKADAVKVWQDLKQESSLGLMLEFKPSLAEPENWYNESADANWTPVSFSVAASQQPGAPQGTQPGAPQATVVSSGEWVLRGTWLFSFDKGVETNGPGADVWWEQQTAVQRALVPKGAARIVNLGHRDFDSLALDELRKQDYETAPIPGNADAGNQLAAGDVFAVHTQGGNFAKVIVVEYGYNLKLRWITYGSATSPSVSPPPLRSPDAQLWRLKLDDAALTGVLASNHAQLSEPTLRVLSTPSHPTSPVVKPSPPTSSNRTVFMRPVAVAAPQIEHVSSPLAQSVALKAAPAGPSYVLHDNFRLQMAKIDMGQRYQLAQVIASSAPKQSAVTDSLSISFDYCLVRIRRPWYIDSFISDQSWFVSANTKGSITRGSSNNSFRILPTGFVVIKNLVIQADWDTADKATAANATNFGPFKVTSGIVQNKLSHEGIQVIGWLLQDMPDLPPNDPPN